MKRMLIWSVLLVLTIGLAQASASGLPRQGTATVLGDLYQTFGGGTVSDGVLNVTLTGSGDHLVTLQIVGKDLSVARLPGIVVDGRLYVVQGDAIVPATAYVARNVVQRAASYGRRIGSGAAVATR